MSALELQSISAGDILVTLVHVEGSAYRQPGAQLVVRGGAPLIGSVSGGCLERDIARQARKFLESGERLVQYDTRAESFLGSGEWGSGCDGVVTVFLQPFEELGEAFVRAAEPQEPQVFALGFSGHWTGRCGLYNQSSVVAGEFSSDERMQEHLRWAFENERSLHVQDGESRALFAYFQPLMKLWIFGAGPDAQVLASISNAAGWRCTVASPDPLKLARFEREATCVLKPNVVPSIGRSEAAIVMTHDLELDTWLVPALLKTDAWFVGLMGPRRRAAKLVARWKEAGQIPDGLERLHTPVGLDLGGDTPADVAVSIVSEIVALRNGRSGGRLRHRESPIHSPIEIRDWNA